MNGGLFVETAFVEEVKRKIQVPIWGKSNLTIDEAAEYSGIGRNK